jgi:signal peptidase I
MADNKRKDDELDILDLNSFGETENIQDTEDVEDTEAFESELDSREKENTQNVKKELLSWVMTFVIALLLAFVLKNYVIVNASVPTGSMENTIQPHDRLFGSRLAYLKEGPERGDIIFFYYPDDETQKYVKRVIGLPGEKVTIKEGKVYINDSEVPLDEPYLKETWIRGAGPYEFVVPEDGYFCMGDNRNSSHDARYWVNTYVMKDKIIGKAIYIYYPFDHMGTVE